MERGWESLDHCLWSVYVWSLETRAHVPPVLNSYPVIRHAFGNGALPIQRL